MSPSTEVDDPLRAVLPVGEAGTHGAGLGALFSEHYGWLRGWLRRKTGNPADAEDLASEAFVVMLGLRGLSLVREPRAMLTTIARRLMFDRTRRQKLETTYLDELASMPQDVTMSAEHQASVLQMLRALDAVLDGLSPKARAAFMYSQIKGLTYAEIASRLSVSVPRVQQYMVSALSNCYALRP